MMKKRLLLAVLLAVLLGGMMSGCRSGRGVAGTDGSSDRSYMLLVRQVCLPMAMGEPRYVCTVSESGTLYVHQLNTVGGLKADTVVYDTVTVARIDLADSDFVRVKALTDYMVGHYKERYTRAAMDGTMAFLKLRHDRGEKEIVFDNVVTRRLKMLYAILNRYLEQTKIGLRYYDDAIDFLDETLELEYPLGQEKDYYFSSKAQLGKAYRWEETKGLVEGGNGGLGADIVSDTFRVMSKSLEQGVYVYVLRRAGDTDGHIWMVLGGATFEWSTDYQVVSVCEDDVENGREIGVGDILVTTLIPYMPNCYPYGDFYYNIEMGSKAPRVLPARIRWGYNVYHALNICGGYYVP